LKNIIKIRKIAEAIDLTLLGSLWNFEEQLFHSRHLLVAEELSGLPWKVAWEC